MAKRKKTSGKKQPERRYKEGQLHASDQPDFVRRAPKPSTIQLVVSALIAFGIIVTATINMDKIGGPATVMSVSAAVFLMSLAVLIVALDHLHGAIFSNEFETALFAGAVATGTEFFILARRTRQVVYVNPGFKEMFGTGTRDSAMNFGDLLDDMGLEPEQRDRLQVALIGRKPLSLVASVKPEGSPRRVVRLKLDPIPRPSGYCVLRGYAIGKGEPGEASGITDVEELLGTMPCGVYKVSSRGALLYANPVLDTLLGYRPGELLTTCGKFAEIVHESFHATSFEESWEGTAAFCTREGSPVRLFLKQVIVPGEGKERMRVGFVMPAPGHASSLRSDRRKGSA